MKMKLFFLNHKSVEPIGYSRIRSCQICINRYIMIYSSCFSYRKSKTKKKVEEMNWKMFDGKYGMDENQKYVFVCVCMQLRASCQKK